MTIVTSINAKKTDSSEPTPSESPLDNTEISDNLSALETEILHEASKSSYRATVSEKETSPEDMIPRDVANTIVSAYAVLNKTDFKTAMVGITYLIQEGGTNSSKINLTRTVNNIPFNINDLRTVIRNNYKGGTVRQLAKTLRKAIANISIINSWPGTLLREINRISTTPIASEDAPFCCEIYSDFYDPIMPPRIRELLQQREREILDAQKTIRLNKKSPSKGGKKKKKS